MGKYFSETFKLNDDDNCNQCILLGNRKIAEEHVPRLELIVIGKVTWLICCINLSKRAHWVLVVINATTGTLFYLDPIHGSLNQRKVMKEMFDNAMMIYRANCNDKRITWSKAKWNTIKCPAQTMI
ncbi:uncharacterized protein LOC130727987 [Lotus japonicus]|uniref:uncharacterized protein LOC130727987 n=1 Tax=Lotus japonicus TaxID=34305 RepID=UPI002585BF28|nr:uncharacterized protein LOC130727987 [Lotus japonicus]